MSDKKNVPKIRFPGFTEPWEQRKFSECTWNAGKRNKEDLDLEPYAITNEHGFIKQSEAHDDFGYMKDTDRKAYNIVMPNSFAYNPARINVGSIGYYEGTENVIVSSLYEVFQTADYVDDRFLWHWFKSDEFPKWIERLQEGSVRLYFYYDKLCECQMLMPSVPEQKKIAEALDNLDNLITLHQRKLEHVKKMKKSMLQKMFPKKNQLYPEVRFPGFTDAWEQRKLGEIATFINGRAYSQDELLNSGKYKVLRVGNFYTNDFWYYSDMELDDKYYAENGDLLYTWSATFGPHIWHGNKVIYHYHIWKIELSKALEKNFALQLLERDKQAILSDKNGSTMVHITKAGMERKEVLLPKNIVEQVKIGQYFTNLDHLITLHQRELDHLQLLKKGMLQQMFI